MQPFNMGQIRDLSKLPKWARPGGSAVYIIPVDLQFPDTTIEFVLNPERWSGRGSRIRVDIRDGSANVQ